MPRSKAVTQMLVNWSQGSPEALDQLIPIVYDELRRMANQYLRRERPDHTLQATALVHEAYLRLIDQTQVRWQNRAHFFAIAAEFMRRILVEHGRSHRAAKRGGADRVLSLDEGIELSDHQGLDLRALDEALNILAAVDPQRSRIVELRFFGGLSIEETAEVLGISPATVKRRWITAKAWLYRELKQGK